MDSADLLLRQEICFKGPGAIRSWICLIIKRIRKVWGNQQRLCLKKTNRECNVQSNKGTKEKLPERLLIEDQKKENT